MRNGKVSVQEAMADERVEQREYDIYRDDREEDF